MSAGKYIYTDPLDLQVDVGMIQTATPTGASTAPPPNLKQIVYDMRDFIISQYKNQSAWMPVNSGPDGTPPEETAMGQAALSQIERATASRFLVPLTNNLYTQESATGAIVNISQIVGMEIINEFTIQIMNDSSINQQVAEDTTSNIVREEALDALMSTMEENKKFDEQCFLMAHLSRYASHYKTELADYPLEHILITETDSGSPVINTFANQVNPKPLLELTTDKLSHLYPKIELHKIYVEKVDRGYQVRKTQPFIFETSESSKEIDSILTSNTGRGTGIGIKNFKWVYTGDNPATAQRLINADLQIYIQDLTYFTKTFTDRADYLDLISFAASRDTPPQVEMQSNICDPAEEPLLPSQSNETWRTEIEARVGWSVPSLAAKDYFSKEELTAISEAQTIIRLSTKDYDFDFNQDGTVTLTISYIGRIEGLFETSSADILKETSEEKEVRQEAEAKLRDYDKDLIERRRSRQEEFQKKVTNARESGDSEEKIGIVQLRDENFKADDADRINRDKFKVHLFDNYRAMRQEKFAQVLQNIEDYGRIFYLKMPISEIAKCAADQPGGKYNFLKDIKPPAPFIYDDGGKLTKWVERSIREDNKAGADVEKKAEQKPSNVADFSESMEINGSKMYVFPYVYLGDILESAASILNKRMDQKTTQYRIATASLVYRDLNCKRKVVNLSDIPISLSVFTTWYSDNFIKNLKPSIPFVTFVRKIMSELVFKALSSACFNGAVGVKGVQPLKVNFVTVSEKLDQKLTKKKRFKIKEVIKSKVNPKLSKVGDTYEYMILSCELYPLNFTGDRKTDEEKGIMHMQLGRDRGLVKTINFSKISIPGLREHFITQGSSLDRVRLPFNTSVEMYGYPFILPGARYYVDPTFTGMGDTKMQNSVARKIGLGGYYVASVVENVIADGTYTTSINGIFDSFPKDVPVVSQQNEALYRPQALPFDSVDRPPYEQYGPKRGLTQARGGIDFDTPMELGAEDVMKKVREKEGRDMSRMEAYEMASRDPSSDVEIVEPAAPGAPERITDDDMDHRRIKALLGGTKQERNAAIIALYEQYSDPDTGGPGVLRETDVRSVELQTMNGKQMIRAEIDLSRAGGDTVKQIMVPYPSREERERSPRIITVHLTYVSTDPGQIPVKRHTMAKVSAPVEVYGAVDWGQIFDERIFDVSDKSKEDGISYTKQLVKELIQDPESTFRFHVREVINRDRTRERDTRQAYQRWQEGEDPSGDSGGFGPPNGGSAPPWM